MNFRIISLALGLALVLTSPLSALAAESAENPATVSANVVQKFASSPATDKEEACRNALQTLLNNKTVSALVYLCDEYSVRTEASTDSPAIATLPSGHQVFIRDFCLTDDALWYQVSFFMDDQEYTGYIEQYHLAYSDEDFLAWEETYLDSRTAALYSSNGSYADVAQFPSSYQASLNSLKAAHPNWTFVRFNTNLDWDTVIKNEDVMTGGEPRNAIPANSPAAWISGNWTSSWSRASTDAIKYYMDPRNFLNDPYIFQFEQLTYNPSYHNASSVQNILNSSFMAGTIPGDSRTYAQAFYEIGSTLGVSPFHLACRVYQEQGVRGTSALISGAYPGYENLYNYFNIGATGSSDTAIITSGLTRARKEGWTTRYNSLLGGARILSQNYILKGQDTLYLQKFDVDNSSNGLYWHQYQQNIKAPCSEGSNIRKAYSNAGALNNNFVFKIPVYNNMPASACPEPGTAPAPASPFTDVTPGDWYYNDVINANNRGWMMGVGSDRFAPSDSLSRCMFSAVLYRLSGSPSVSYKPYFSDVPDGVWYSSAIVWAYENHIVSGIGNGTFCPNENITREQMAKMLKNYAAYRGFDTTARVDLNSFVDAASVSTWAADDVRWAASLGFITGKPNGNGLFRIDPQGNATRAECASILNRFFHRFGQ